MKTIKPSEIKSHKVLNGLIIYLIYKLRMFSNVRIGVND